VTLGVPERDRRRLAQAADRASLDRHEPLLELGARHRGFALLELGEHVLERARPDAARRALLTRLLGEEAHRLAHEA
jgi:hypothetical protein